MMLCVTEVAFQSAQPPAARVVLAPIPIGVGRDREVRSSVESELQDGLPEAILDGPPAAPEPRPVPSSNRPGRRGPDRAWVVFIESSPDEPVSITKDSMVIGRSRACDIILPSAKVSRQHATVSMIEGDLFIEDLGSSNGVWRNGERIARERLSPGDIIVLSDETLRFEWA